MSINYYEQYVLKGIGIETKIDFHSGCIDGMLVDKEFTNEVLTNICLTQRQNIELSVLITKVCEMHNLTQEELRSPGKHAKPSQARAILAFLVREMKNLSLESLGQFLNRDASGLTKLASRLEIKITTNTQSAKDLQAMRQWLLEHT